MEYKSLEITEEEKEALKAYCEWEHSYINLLTSGDLKTICKFNNEELNIFSKEYFEKSMNILKNIYSAMYKYSYYNSDMFRVVRGTTLAEVESMKREYTKLLSTTKDEQQAKTFAGSKVIQYGKAEEKDKKGAILRLSIGENVPYISVNNVLREESNHDMEQEIIIAPFNIMESIEHVSNWEGYQYYSAKIKRQELQPEENDKLFEEISQQIGKIPELLEGFQSNNNQLERFSSAKRLYPEERKYIHEQETVVRDNLCDIITKFNAIRSSMVKYAKGICYDAEKEIKQNLEQEKIEIKRQEIEKAKAEINASLGNSVDIIGESLKQIQEKSDKYKNIAKKLELEWNEQFSEEQFENLYQQFKNEVEDLKDDKSTVKQNEKEDILKEQQEDLKKKKNIANKVLKCANEIKQNNIQFNDEECTKYIKTELNKKINEQLRKAEIEQIDDEIQKIRENKIGLIGKILGREKEAKLKEQQLLLKKNLLQISSQEIEECGVHEMLAKVLCFQKDNNGVLTEELQTTITQIRKVFKINENRLQNIVEEKRRQTALVPTTKRTSLFRRKDNELLEKANRELKEKLDNLSQNSNRQYREELQEVQNVTTIPEKTYYNLQQVNKIIKDREIVKDNSIALE